MRTDDGYIIYQCLNGDPDAFGLLVDKYKAGVYALAYSKLRNFHDAQDVAQEVFIRAYENLHKLRRWESFAWWLYRITSRQCRNWIRAQSKRPDYEFIEDRDTGILDGHSMDSYWSELVSQSVHDALDSLPEMHRQVLTLRYLGGMNSFEIARFVGVSPAAVRRRLVNARAALKAEMLDTMSEVFEEQRLQAIFTLRILEMVKHIRIRPLPDKLIPWGMGTGIVLIILTLGLSGNLFAPPGYYDATTSMETAGLTGEGDFIPVDIVDESVMESGGDKMLKNTRSSTFVATVAMLSVLSGSAMSGEAPGVEWERVIGTPNGDIGKYIQQTADGGYIAVGDTAYNEPKAYVYLVKTDENGYMVWDKAYTTYRSSLGSCVQQTTDEKGCIDGYIIVGSAELGQNNSDAYLIKTDENGNVDWEKTYGSSYGDSGKYVQQTSDGGYIIAGHHKAGDAWLFKTDGLGNLKWEQTFGGNGDEYFGSMLETTDGYIAVGSTKSFGSGMQAYMVKTDKQGNKIWENAYGGSDMDYGYDVAQTPDGGYIIAGPRYFPGLTNDYDVYIVKTDANGNPLWEKTYDGGVSEWADSIRPTSDGGYIIGGGKGIYSTGKFDCYMLKIDDEGNVEWEGTYGNEETEERGKAIQTADGGYVIGGYTGHWYSSDRDFYLVKLEPEYQPPAAFEYALFGSAGKMAINEYAAISGDVYNRDEVEIKAGAAIDGLLYTTKPVKGGGFYELGTLPDPLPVLPALDITPYQSMLSDAASRPGGDMVVHHLSLSGGTILVNGRFVLENDGSITGPGTIVAIKGVEIKNRCSIDEDVSFISEKKVAIKEGTVFEDSVDNVLFSSEAIILEKNTQVSGALLSMLALTISEFSQFTGIAYSAAGELLIKESASIEGSVVSYTLKGVEKYVKLTYDEGIVRKICMKMFPAVEGPAAAPPVIPEQSRRTSEKVMLSQNYPNPFNPETWIPYKLAEEADVIIKVYASTGRLIRMLNLGHKPAGFYIARDKAAYWDGRNEAGEQVSSGTYFYTIQAGDLSATRKMVVAR